MHNPELLDYIGVESSIDFKSDVEFDAAQSVTAGKHRRCRKIRSAEAEREYPPPIPWLARTENLPSHMPWVMRRYYTSDGRLVIKEEKVKRHEYFQAHRSDGRLVLNLVPMDDVVDESFKEDQADGEISGGDEMSHDPAVEDAFRCSGGGVVAATCGVFGVAVSALAPPLHI